MKAHSFTSVSQVADSEEDDLVEEEEDYLRFTNVAQPEEELFKFHYLKNY